MCPDGFAKYHLEVILASYVVRLLEFLNFKLQPTHLELWIFWTFETA